MRFLLRLIFSSIFIMILAHQFPGIYVRDLYTSLIVALVLSFLNAIVKPVLVILTLPITIFTLGLFLLVINAAIVLFCTELVDGFHVSGWLTAFWFSLALSFFQYLIEKLTEKRSK